jgi:hypothetical protein
MDERQIDQYRKQLNNRIQKTIDETDPFRIQSYGQLERIQTAKAKVLNKQKRKLSAKLGSDHARVKKIEGKIALRKHVLRGVRAERRRAETEQPDIAPKNWILHGYLYDEKEEPLSGLIVMLAEKSGKLIKPLGQAKSEKKGYFRLIVEDIAKWLEKVRESKEAPKKILVYAQVLDSKKVVLHRSKRALGPGPGQTDYLEIVITKEADQVRLKPIRPINPIRLVKPMRPVKPVRPVKPKKVKAVKKKSTPKTKSAAPKTVKKKAKPKPGSPKSKRGGKKKG